MNKSLIYLLICIVLIGSASAYPTIINRVGTENSSYNNLIKQVPKEYLDRLDTIEIVKEFNYCGWYSYSYINNNIIYSKIKLNNECCEFKDCKEILYHELGHHNDILINGLNTDLLEEYAEKWGYSHE